MKKSLTKMPTAGSNVRVRAGQTKASTKSSVKMTQKGGVHGMSSFTLQTSQSSASIANASSIRQTQTRLEDSRRGSQNNYFSHARLGSPGR